MSLEFPEYPAFLEFLVFPVSLVISGERGRQIQSYGTIYNHNCHNFRNYYRNNRNHNNYGYNNGFRNTAGL